MLYQLLRFIISLLPWGTIRTKWIVRFHIFKKVGTDFYFCPRKLPADPKLIEFGDNVAVATDVMFINHDVPQKVSNNMYEEELPRYFDVSELEIMFLSEQESLFFLMLTFATMFLLQQVL